MTKPITVSISEELDLHTFLPNEVECLLQEYFRECIKKQIFLVRVVHGKGTGTLKKRVYSALKKNPLVAGFRDASPNAGGWGATLVELRTNTG